MKRKENASKTVATNLGDVIIYNPLASFYKGEFHK